MNHLSTITTLTLIAALSACSPALDTTMPDTDTTPAFINDDPVDDVGVEIAIEGSKNCAAKGRADAEPNGKAFDGCDDG